MAQLSGAGAFKPLRMLRKKSSSHPARLSFMESDPFEVSCRTTSRARRRRTAMLPGALSLRLRAASSRKDTSSCQCRTFSMAQCARTVASSTSGSGIQDSAKHRVSELVFPSSFRVASFLPKALRPGNSWCSANPVAETTTAFRCSLRPWPLSTALACQTREIHAGIVRPLASSLRK